jgi:hypothetical protein
MENANDLKGLETDPTDPKKIARRQVTIAGGETSVQKARRLDAAATSTNQTGEREQHMVERRTAKRVGKSRKPAKPGTPAAGHATGKPRESGKRVLLQARVRPQLRKEVRRLADEAGVTTQTYVLLALREYGAPVLDVDLDDLRKGEHRARRPRSKASGDTAADQLQQLIKLVSAGRLSGRCATSGLTDGITGNGLTLIINNHFGMPRPDP